MAKNATEKSHNSKDLPGLFRATDLEAHGIPRGCLRSMLQKGEVEQVGRGLYRLANLEPNELETVALVASAVPAGIVWLLSALQMHEIGTQSPHQVWIAIDRKARKPSRIPAKVRIVRFSKSMLTYGIQIRSILGVSVKVTNPARTVVDCFRYRNKIGLDVALEALRDAVRTRKATVDQIMRAAEVCRARTVMRRLRGRARAGRPSGGTPRGPPRGRATRPAPAPCRASGRRGSAPRPRAPSPRAGVPPSALTLLMAPTASIAGGVGTVIGPVIGATILPLTSLVLQQVVPYSDLVLYGAIIVIVVMVEPGGVMSILRRSGVISRRTNHRVNDAKEVAN